MPVYEYKCVECDDVFEQRRSMSEADDGVRCPDGHTGVRRLLSVFAAGGRAGGSAAPAPAATAPMRGCGAGCGCH